MNIANKVGKYRGFTGRIKCGFTDCNVFYSDFDILEKKIKFKDKINIHITFHKGLIKGGKLSNADVTYAHITNSKLTRSVFRGGLFKNSTFNRSVWLDGKWVDSFWDCSFDKFLCIRGLPPTEWSKEPIIWHKGKANSIGNYQNFNGTIDWKGTKLEVEDASFDLIKNV